MGTCVTCVKGKFSVEASGACTDCLVGTYATGSGFPNECTKCAAGKHNSNPGRDTADVCISCELGKYSKEGYGDCAECESGKYAPATGTADDCTWCNAGKHSTASQATAVATCEDCAEGTYSDRAATSCAECEKGSYATGAGSPNHCDYCTPGKANGNRGSIVATACVVCNAGTYSQEGKSSCTDCPGECVVSMLSCPCECVVDPSHACECAMDCAVGKYGPESEANHCEECLSGKANGNTKRTTEVACVICDAGKYSDPAAALCTSCPMGKISAVAGSGPLSCIMLVAFFV